VIAGAAATRSRRHHLVLIVGLLVDDGGRTWRVTGSPFPVDWGFSTLQFISPEQGYIFGNSGLLDTSDGGRSWHEVTGLNGTLERAILIDSNVWATGTTCPLPGVPGPCSVGVAISTDGGETGRTPSGGSSWTGAEPGSVPRRTSVHRLAVMSRYRKGQVS